MIFSPILDCNWQFSLIKQLYSNKIESINLLYKQINSAQSQNIEDQGSMIEQPPVAPETVSQTKSQGTQNRIRHQRWLLLQCQFWIYTLFILSLSMYIISQCAKADQEIVSVYQTDQHKYGLQAIQHWKKGYIVDIRSVDTDNCPEGYTQLINYYWSGTIDGCYCPTIVGKFARQFILEGACSSQLIYYGCTTIDSLNAQNMKMWKGSKLLCYKRVDSLSFYNSTLQKTPTGTTMATCAIGKNYQVSNLPQVACPESAISNSSLGSSSQIKLTLDSANQLYLYYDAQQNYPIADFKITQYNFCPYWSQINISPNKNGNYILQRTNFSQTCTKKDPRIVQFDYMTQQDYFTNNTRIYDLIQTLPGFPRPSISYYYKLGFIRYAAWTYACRTSASHNLLAATKHLEFTHVSQKTKLVLYVCVPCLIVIGILFRILYTIRHIFELKSKKQYNMLILTDQQIGQQIPNLNILKSFKRQLFYQIIQFIFILAIIVVLCIGAYTLIMESLWIKEMFNKSCTEDHLNWIFRFSEDKVDVGLFVLGRSLMLVLVILLVEICHFVIRVKFGDLKANEVKQIQSLSNQNLIKNDLDQKAYQKDNAQNINLQDSSDIILRKQRQQLKVYDLDNFMSNQIQGGAGQTGFNFYANQSISIEQEAGLQIGKKKKKKGIKRKNLFKNVDSGEPPQQ